MKTNAKSLIKRAISILIIVCILGGVSVGLYFLNRTDRSSQLLVYAPDNAFDNSTVTAFEHYYKEKYGLKDFSVKVSGYYSSDKMVTNLTGNELSDKEFYDVVVSDTISLEDLYEKNCFIEIDKSKLNNLGNIDENLINAGNEYGIKLLNSMHFNTVIYDINNGYMQLPEEVKEKYDIKWWNGGAENMQFGSEYVLDDPTTPENETQYPIEQMHGALPFGEPQLDDGTERLQPMRVFSKLSMFRNVPLASDITLTHEPAFYRYAGLSDYVHYDAYRINAPFSDFWLHYYNYSTEGKFGWWFAAPLETTGDYMRTLNKLNNPNSVSAWTQGACTWSTLRRFTPNEQYRYDSNPYETRIQAYENVANGATSLYWFNITKESLLFQRETAREMLYCNRELAVLEQELAYQVPFYYNRTDNFDKNLNVGSDYALLYVNDLNYKLKHSEYIYSGTRGKKEFSFSLPQYLSEKSNLIKVTKDGVQKIDFSIKGDTICFTDEVNMTGLYLFSDLSTEVLKARFDGVMAEEDYNYLENEEAYNALLELVGTEDGENYMPKKVKEDVALFNKIYWGLGGLGVLIVLISVLIIVLKVKKRKTHKQKKPI